MTQDQRGRAGTLTYWAVFAACQALGLAQPFVANAHDSSWVLAIPAWLLLLPGTLFATLLDLSDRISTAVILLLVVAMNVVVWCAVGIKLCVHKRPS